MVQILDFYDAIVNKLIGDATLFIAFVFTLIGFIMVRSRTPNIVFLFFGVAVLGLLSIQFPVLRWGLAVLVGGFVGWIFIRLRRE